MKRTKAFAAGLRDGVPIGLGYLSVAFSLGIAARNAGIDAVQGFVMSWLGMASAGEYAAITVIAAGAPYWEMALVTLVTNMRYLLMSFALGQRLDPALGLGHRLLIGYAVTDELFGISVAQPRPLEPAYCYGAYAVAIPSWAAGTALGILAGNVLPARVVSALYVALFGMFLAVIVPPARKDRAVAALVLLGFGMSFLFARLPGLSALSAGTRTVLLTVLLAAGAALLRLIKEDDDAA